MTANYQSPAIIYSPGSIIYSPGSKTVSEPDVFDESRFVMTFLIILAVAEILYSFRLVLEGKFVKEMSESSRLKFLEKSLANNFALSDAEDNTSGSLNRVSIADLHLLKTLRIQQNSLDSSLWEETGSFFYEHLQVW